MGGATLSFFTMIKGLKDLGITPIVVIPANKKINPFFLKEMEKIKLQYEKVYLCQSVSLEANGFNLFIQKIKRLLLH